MRFYLVSLFAFAAAWTAAWFAFIGPFLRHYAATTALMARLDAAEGDLWAKAALRLEGRKALVLLFLTSLGGALRGAADQAAAAAAAATEQLASAAGGLTPEAVAPLEDRAMWSALVGDAAALHVLAALQLLAAFLVLKGHLTAAKLEPRR